MITVTANLKAARSAKGPGVCVCVGCLFFKDTEPSPLQDSSSVCQHGGPLPARWSPARIVSCFHDGDLLKGLAPMEEKICRNLKKLLKIELPFLASFFV
jgi:hypothetical protein